MFAALLSLLWSGVGWLLSLLWTALLGLLSPLPLAMLAVTFGTFYYYMTVNYDFWPSRGVSGPPTKFPGGHGLKDSDKVTEVDRQLYEDFGGKRYCGYMELRRPVFFTGDPELIRAITIKDFEHFTDRRHFAQNEDFKKFLSVLSGPEWKTTRAVMTPSFSTSKLKGMHQLTLNNATNLSKYLQEEMAQKGEVDAKDCFGRFTMDNIASCAFGVNSNSFTDPNAEFAKHASSVFKPFKGFSLVRLLCIMLFSDWFMKLPDPIQPSIDFLKRVVRTTVRHRESSTTSRRDFLQLLLEARDKDGNRVLSDDSLVTQSILFLFAGYDTTATLMSYAAYSLATNPDVQRQAQEEVDAVLERHDGQMTYDAVAEMSYLDRVLSETLRLYPPAPRMERQCTKEYAFPGTDITIPAGILVQMPVLMIHRDPDHYPDPLHFDPDRFLPEEKEKRHPCAYLPFGSGPRNCIAMRFALFETKVAVAAVLRENTLTRGPRTPDPPLSFDKTTFLLTPKDAYVKVLPRDGTGA